MNKRILSIIGLLAIGFVIFWAGVVYGQSGMGGAGWSQGGMMSNFGRFGPSGNFGMMGNDSGLADADPLSIEEVETAVTNYLSSLGQNNLTLGEVMIFDNHAYAQIIDESREQAAFEVLVDPVTHNVFPEPGPNMMWNTEYSPMAGGIGVASSAETIVTAAEAVSIAQQYLDSNLSGAEANAGAVAFPGYYTIHTEQDGQISGMLSVNAYTGQIILHRWHGNFIEMTGSDHS